MYIKLMFRVLVIHATAVNDRAESILRLRGQGTSESCQSPSSGLTGWRERAVCEQAGGETGSWGS